MMNRFVSFRTTSGGTLMVNPAKVSRFYADGPHTVLVFGPGDDSNRVAETFSTVSVKLSVNA